MNINIVNFAGALGIQAANNDLVLIGGDDGGGQSYVQTQSNVRLESKGRLLVQPATDGADAVEVRNAVGDFIVQVDSTNKTMTLTGDANPALVVASEIDGPFLQVTPTSLELAIFDPLTPTNSVTLNPTDVAVGDGAQSGNIAAGRVGVTDTGTGNALSLTVPGAVATITSQDGASNPFPLNLVIEELQLNANPGNAGEVLTSNGPNAAPTWQAAGGAGLGSKVLLVVEGGSYATVQAAIDAASDTDVILVGPKASHGSWGPAVFSAGKRLSLIGLGPKVGEVAAKIDSITFSPTTGLNILLNTVYVRGLFITGDFSLATGVTFGGTAPARLRLQECFVYNSGASGNGVTSNNSGSGSSLYIDNCTVQAASSAGVGLDHVQGYTIAKNGVEISRWQYPVQCAAGSVEVYNATIDGTGIANEVIRITGGLVTVAYSTVLNRTTNSSGVNMTTAGAAFAISDASFTIATGTGYCVNGVASTVYLYGNVSYTNTAAAAYNVKVKNTITALPITQTFTSSP